MFMGNPLPALSRRLLLLCPPVAFRAHLESLLLQEALPSLESDRKSTSSGAKMPEKCLPGGVSCPTWRGKDPRRGSWAHFQGQQDTEEGFSLESTCIKS